MKHDMNYDVVEHPKHYKKYKLETIDNIQNSMTQYEFIGYLKGNIKKYLDRYQDKNGVQDLKKARWYLNKLIEVEADEAVCDREKNEKQ